MIKSICYPVIAVLLISSCAATARTRKKTPVRSQNPRLIEATVQRTMPGRQEAQPMTTYRMVIVWNSPQTPETFFWRPEGDQWMTCQVTRIRKKPKTSPQDPTGLWYATEIIRLEDIHKGDTLELVPIPGGRDIMPAAARKNGVKSIYYHTAGGGWQTVPVSAFRKLPNLIMP